MLAGAALELRAPVAEVLTRVELGRSYLSVRHESSVADAGAACRSQPGCRSGGGGEDAVAALAEIAAQVNSTVENIGARRLQTVMERVLDEISFEAADKNGETIAIDAAYVRARIGDLAKNTDLSKFIL